VIKELVENAVDAGAARIAITVEAGGKRLIRVDDDGEGMDADDARLAVERHATSKLRHADDLERIATLGFRGRGRCRASRRCPGSRFVPHRRPRLGHGNSHRGRRPRCPWPRPAGRSAPSIEVRDLFFNLPARRKFLKTDAAEMAQVTRVVTQLALCYAGVGFSLSGAARKPLEYPPVASLRDRIFQI
jgi:DNA mismatch repair protein MutL